MAHTGGRRNRIECQGIVGAPERVEARHVHLGWDQPSVCGVAPGVPGRVDRLRGLGNAIVPQVAEFLFRRIQEVA
jgi:DNA (cytosine-5)-methyltransferase 1